MRKYRVNGIWKHTYLEKNSNAITCPNCLEYIHTKVHCYNSWITHIIAATLFPMCLCSLPYCNSIYKNAIHYCPSCGIYLGINHSNVTEYFACSCDS